MARTSVLIAPVQPVLHRVSYSNETLPNAPKYYETHLNMSLGFNRVDKVCSLRIILMRLRGKNFWINCTSSAVLHQASCINETIQNAPKYYETHQYMSLGSNGVDQLRSLQKIPKRLRRKNFCINCTSSARFAPNFIQ